MLLTYQQIGYSQKEHFAVSLWNRAEWVKEYIKLCNWLCLRPLLPDWRLKKEQELNVGNIGG